MGWLQGTKTLKKWSGHVSLTYQTLTPLNSHIYTLTIVFLLGPKVYILQYSCNRWSAIDASLMTKTIVPNTYELEKEKLSKNTPSHPFCWHFCKRPYTIYTTLVYMCVEKSIFWKTSCIITWPKITHLHLHTKRPLIFDFMNSVFEVQNRRYSCLKMLGTLQHNNETNFP